MAGLGQMKVGLSDEARDLIKRGIEAIVHLTAELRAYNTPVVEYAEKAEEMRPPLPHAPEVTEYLGMQRITVGEHVEFYDPSPGLQIIDAGTVRITEGYAALMIPQWMVPAMAFQAQKLKQKPYSVVAADIDGGSGTGRPVEYT